MAKYIKTEQGYKTKEELAIQPDWNQNAPNAPDYVKNRPFYDARDKVEYTFDGNLEGKETITAPFDENAYLVKVANEIPERSLIAEVNACWSTPFGFDGEENGLVNDAIVEEAPGIYNILGAGYYFSENADVPFPKGLYLMGSENEEDKCWASKLTFVLDIGEIKSLDEKYMPYSVMQGVSRALAMEWKYAGSIPKGTKDDAISVYEFTVPRFKELLIIGGFKGSSANSQFKIKLNSDYIVPTIGVRNGSWHSGGLHLECLDAHTAKAFIVTAYGFCSLGAAPTEVVSRYITFYNAQLYNDNIIKCYAIDHVEVAGEPVHILYR